MNEQREAHEDVTTGQMRYVFKNFAEGNDPLPEIECGMSAEMQQQAYENYTAFYGENIAWYVDDPDSRYGVYQNSVLKTIRNNGNEGNINNIAHPILLENIEETNAIIEEVL